MNAKKGKHKKPQPVPVKETIAVAPNRNLNWLLVAGVAIITFLCYQYTLQNEFTHWDDNLYVEDCPYIKDLTPQNMKMILFHNITNNYYHPITMLSVAWNYHYAKMSPHAYYLTNVVIHILNTCVMFFLVLFLLEAMTEKGYGAIRGKPWLAALGALLYGIHPMHVESVSWFAERKDVLYGFFYFLGLIAYIKYAKEEKLKWIVIVFACYICSLLSKPLAVVFPLSLFAFDFLLKKKDIKRLAIEKIPFFLISLCAGLWAFKAQKLSGAMNAPHAFSIWQRFMYAGYGFVMYVVKAFIPFNLAAYYPYPNPNASMPAIFYLAPFIAALIVIVPLYLARKAGDNIFRIVVFGLGFFFFNVVFVLQFVSSGPALMAERYSYIAYFGLFAMLIYFISQLIEKRPSMKMPMQIGLVVFSCMLWYISYGRVQTWHNTETLWRDVVRHSPYPIAAEYENLGNYYANKGMIDSAYNNFKIAVDLNSPDAGVYANIGNIYGMRKQYDKSLASYTHALSIDSSDFDTYLNRAITYAAMGRYDMALKDDEHASKINPNSQKLFEDRGANYLNNKQYDKSIADYNRLVQIDPSKPLYYLNRGIAEFDKNDIKAAIEDFTHTLTLDPANANCMYYLSIAYQKNSDNADALNYALKAKQNGYPVTDDYISSLQKSRK